MEGAMNDNDITRCVQILLALLHDEPNIVRAEVEGSIVYLQGIATNERQKHDIEEAVGYINGVQQVVNCLALEHVARLPTTPPPVPAATLVERRLADFTRQPRLLTRGRSHHSFARPFTRRGLHTSSV